MYRCPKCKTSDSFTIEHLVRHKTTIAASGEVFESEESDLCWEDDDSIVCDECGQKGTTASFEIDEQEDEEEGA